MVNFRHTFIALTAATLAAGVPSAANAFSIGGHYNETEFHDLGLDIALSAESRYGSGSVGGNTFELDIHDSSFYNYDQAEFNWANGEAVNFSLSFDSALKKLTYTVGGVNLFANTVDDNFSDLFIRTATRNAGSSMVVDNLKLKDSSTGGSFVNIAETSEVSCAVAADCDSFWESGRYLRLADISGDFTLEGQSTMTWDPNNEPSQSRLAYQIKMIAGEGETPTSADVPEPTSAIALALVGGAFAAVKRRK